MRRIAIFLACAALTAPAWAEDTVKDTFKKVEKGTGQLLQGIGQEVKKAGDSVSKAAKKKGKPAAKVKEERK